MSRFRFFTAALLTVFGLAAGDAAIAAAETNISNGLTLKGPGLAVHGYDVVAYFADAQPTVGRAEHSTVYNGATYRFANEGNLESFESNPEAYVPQYGGYCAYGVSVGAKFDGDPHLWRIVAGKLYLNLNGDIQRTWEEDIPANITKANRNWTRIASKTPRELS